MPRGRHHGNAAKAADVGPKSEGPFGKQDFAYLPGEDACRCPAGEPYRHTNEDGKMLRRYWTTACQNC